MANILPMRALTQRTGLLRTLVVAALTVMVWSAGAASPVSTPAADAAPNSCGSERGNPADERRLEKLTAERVRVQKKLTTVLNTGETLRAQIELTDAEHDTLVKRQRRFDRQAGAAHSELASRVRRSYMWSNADPVLTMLAATDATTVVERSRLLGLLAEDSQAHVERATSAAERTRAAAEQAEQVGAQLSEMRAEHRTIEQRTRRLLKEVKKQETDLSKKVALQRARRGSDCAMPAGATSDGLACPVDQPRNFTDTYGAPRSGGRSHLGVDILAPNGTPIRAYENGTITRMDSNALGGISLYLRGGSGNVYYYTHLSGYVSGMSTGQSVTAGQHIAFVGATGNAPVPHLHWEVQPGGTGNVNPYPYAKSACG